MLFRSDINTRPLLLRSTSGGHEYEECQTLLIKEFDQLSTRYLFSKESRDSIKQIVSIYNCGSSKETFTFIQALDTLVLSSAFNNRETSPSCFHKIPYIRMLALYIEKKRFLSKAQALIRNQKDTRLSIGFRHEEEEDSLCEKTNKRKSNTFRGLFCCCCRPSTNKTNIELHHVKHELTL